MGSLAAVEDLKAGKLTDFLQDVQVVTTQLTPLLDDCKVVQEEFEHLLTSLKQMNPAQAEANFKLHQMDILQAMSSFDAARQAADYEEVGRSVGIILRKLIEEDG